MQPQKVFPGANLAHNQVGTITDLIVFELKTVEAIEITEIISLCHYTDL